MSPDPFDGWSNYRKMMNGIRPEGCTCVLIHPVRYEGGQAIEPAEFKQDFACPIHGEASRSPEGRDGRAALETKP